MIAEIYCSCGANLRIHHQPYPEAREVMDGFWLYHRGDGHQEITKGQAMRAEFEREKAAFAGQVAEAVGVRP